ncbi:hypothetical protein GCM10007874_37090 [Labrys miyagiensis]|uniref:Uncharacterized protein n=2 Tax=Labrys miyagiensis TaxID=346912 RepID=A0ABQ6CM23_9HYPH|nr:hypothetical protein GCM10007874_37090 [Labrys miyagiensis]
MQQQAQLNDALQKTAARSPKTITGAALDQCLNGFVKYSNASFPGGRTGEYSEAGVYSVVRYFPIDPAYTEKIGNLVSYKVVAMINRDKPSAYETHLYCYYENVGGKLRYLTVTYTNQHDELQLNYKWNMAEGVYQGLTGKMLRIH